ncbi:MAG TPA: glycosyltransferase [Gemmatimonadaceae bacterium]|nr:glycosyltransferase [Gemmatimonadaceae bacterium]
MELGEFRPLLVEALLWVDHVIIAYFLVLNSFYALLLLLAIPEMMEHWRISDDDNLRLLRGTDVVPPISVLVPAYNEQATIVASVLSFLTLEYPSHEVVVVNDGSTDDTMRSLIAAYELYKVPAAYPHVVPTAPVRGYYRSRVYSKLSCIDKDNGGKGDSLNAAVNAARFGYVLAVDADTLIERDALLRLARPFLLGEPVAAVGATVRVVNGSTVVHGIVTRPRVDSRWLPGIQTVEYLRAFLFGRLGWNRLGGSLIISGAFGLFKQEHLQAVGGYHTESVTEDMDIVIRLHKHLRATGSSESVQFIPDPVAWTEVPATLRGLNRQRERWHRGLISTMIEHRGVCFNPRYGRLGFIAYPFFLLGEMLAPLIELVGYLAFAVSFAMGAADVPFVLLFLAVSIGYGLLLSLWATVLEEISFRRYPAVRDFLLLIWFSLLEAFGYRQITLWFRLQAYWKYFRKDRDWGEMKREGFDTAQLRARAP